MLRKMQLVLDQVRKPIRALRKSLRDLRGNLPQQAVHNLRTRSRRLEAVSAALPQHEKKNTHRMLKSIKPLRKAAGEVRDMDVLQTKVRLLMRRSPDPSFERLLAHLQSARAESARQLADGFSTDWKTIRRRLKTFSRHVEEEFSKELPDARQAHVVFDELSRWPRLNAANLHDFRIRIKELRYMLQLMQDTNPALLNALENAKVRIGTWHDWHELYRIAADVLHASKDRAAIATIAEVEAKKFRQAMHAAQSLRTRYLRSPCLQESIEP
jgi:CHAD domain-containing protein